MSKALDVLLELKDCSDYWSEYFVPLGIHERIDDAIQELLAQPEPEPNDTEIITAYQMLVRRKLGLHIPVLGVD